MSIRLRLYLMRIKLDLNMRKWQHRKHAQMAASKTCANGSIKNMRKWQHLNIDGLRARERVLQSHVSIIQKTSRKAKFNFK